MQPSSLRIAIADEQPVVRFGLESLFTLNEMSVCAQFEKAEALLKSDLSGSDILLLGLEIEPARLLALIRQLVRSYPQLRIVVFTSYSTSFPTTRALAEGAAGVLHKSFSLEEIVRVLRQTCMPNGKDGLAVKTKGAAVVDNLSRREAQILRMLSTGSRPTEIALSLSIHIGTVTSHIHRTKKKLGARSIGDLVAYCYRNGLV